eukprot:9470878-Lingulodinium_polyedra.AAC.1
MARPAALHLLVQRLRSSSSSLRALALLGPRGMPASRPRLRAGSTTCCAARSSATSIRTSSMA